MAQHRHERSKVPTPFSPCGTRAFARVNPKNAHICPKRILLVLLVLSSLMCRLRPIRMFSSIPPREQFRVFLEAYKDDVRHRFVGAGGKRLICLPHETSYGLGIENKTNRKCMVEIVIGEVVLGEFIISPRATVVIKRGSKHDKSLVFISNSSDIAEHLALPDHKLLGSGEIFVSVRPQVVPVEERYSSRRN